MGELVSLRDAGTREVVVELMPENPFPSFVQCIVRIVYASQPIRDILSACGSVNEMLLNRKHTQLAGNLIMNEYMPKVIETVAENRWVNAKNMNAKILVTECPAEYIMLAKTKPEDIELMTIEEVVLKCL